MAATFKSQILHGWDWPRIEADMRAALDQARALLAGGSSLPDDGLDAGDVNVHTDDQNEGAMEATIYIGRLYRESPSGAFYAPWSAIPESVRDRDARWYEAFENVARKHGMEPISGEGDPTDTYLAMWSDYEVTDWT